MPWAANDPVEDTTGVRGLDPGKTPCWETDEVEAGMDPPDEEDCERRAKRSRVFPVWEEVGCNPSDFYCHGYGYCESVASHSYGYDGYGAAGGVPYAYGGEEERRTAETMLGGDESVHVEGVQPTGGALPAEVERPEINEIETQNPDEDEEDPFIFADEQGGPGGAPIYKIVINPSGEVYHGTSDEAILLKWHHRLGHVNMRYLLRIAQRIPGMEELTKIKSTCKIPTCRACALGKLKAKSLPSATFKRAENPLDRLHLDASGQIHCKSYGGHQYFLVIVDDATGYKWSYVMRSKKDYLACIDHLFTRLGNMLKMLRATPRALRTDNAGEMISAEAREYMTKHKIWHELCNPYEHHQNPLAEAAIGNVGARARTMLVSSGVPKRHWQQAIMYATEIDNRTLPTSRGSAITCFEAFHGVKPDNCKAMPFGCLAYLHRSKALRKEGKFDPTAIRCVFLGFAFHLGHKGYLLGSLTSRRFYVATNVNFAEGEFPYLPQTEKQEAAKEFWGQDIEGQGAKSIPHGPSIEAWDEAGDDPANVEIWLEEED
eukprot:147923-Rhodomonas_salina.2